MVENNHYFSIEESRAYKISSELGEIVWDIVQKWPWLARRTIGIQWIDATDSISANLIEGFGRYHKKDRVKFYFNAKGSAMESEEWMKKAAKRRLISKSEYEKLTMLFKDLPREINFQIKFSMEKLTR